MLDIAYVAGLIDGEGCVHLDVSRHRIHRARVSVGMTEPALGLLKSLKQGWGGTIYQARKATEKWAAAYTWHITGEKASVFLREVGPSLLLKAEQARLALQVEEIWAALPPRQNGQRLWDEKSVERCREIAASLHDLNRKGPKKKISAQNAEG